MVNNQEKAQFELPPTISATSALPPGIFKQKVVSTLTPARHVHHETDKSLLAQPGGLVGIQTRPAYRRDPAFTIQPLALSICFTGSSLPPPHIMPRVNVLFRLPVHWNIHILLFCPCTTFNAHNYCLQTPLT